VKPVVFEETPKPMPIEKKPKPTPIEKKRQAQSEIITQPHKPSLTEPNIIQT
jgi:hypothetical protein